jgi:2-keto-4-pentenoate hydratase/2-oxohepta-3-ene-1,7-dioic acid hydratase in catechol pathway
MRLVSYLRQGTARGGVIVGDSVIDLRRFLTVAGVAPTSSVREFLTIHSHAIGSLSAEASRLADLSPEIRAGALADLRLLSPVPDPGKVLCIGLNYKDHVAETGRALPQYPDVFVKFASTLIGPQDEIRGADLSDNLDFEGEVAVVIGRRAHRVSEGDALSYVAGLAPLNDTTARDLQYRGTQWTAGKAVDGSTPWGPAIVTLDEVGDPQTLEIRTRVNGVEMQHSNTRHQIFTIAKIVSYLSGFLALEPGDVIATGTPQGIGAKRTPPVWLAPGDVVEVDVDRVGLLRNRVATP